MDTTGTTWHEASITVDTFINADGEERPGYVFKLNHPPDCRADCCLLEQQYWPPEFHEIPGIGDYRVRYVPFDGGSDGLQWEFA